MVQDRTSVVADLIGDHALLEAARGGDHDAFVTLVKKYHATLTQLAHFYAAAEKSSSDVVKRTWQTVLEGPANADNGISSLKTQLYRGVLKHTGDRRRSNASPPFAATTHLADDSYGGAIIQTRFRPASDVVAPLHWLARPASWRLPVSNNAPGAEDLRSVIERALDGLSPGQHEVILLRDVLGWAADEVSDALAISDAMQRTLLHRARASVRNRLEEHLTP